MDAVARDGMDGLAVADVEDGDESGGHRTAGVGVKTILVHEYVNGGGLAGQDLPRSLAIEGAAIRGALAAEFAALEDVRVLLTLDDRFSDGPGPWQSLAVGEGAELDVLATLASEVEGVILVAPETGGILRERAELVASVAGRSLGSTPSAIALAGDKLRLAERLSAQGLSTPPSRAVDPEAGPPRDLAYPVVLKPIEGAGSTDTFYVDSAQGWPQAPPPRSLVQPFVPGQALSASYLVGADGRPHLVGVAQQLMERSGRRFRYVGGRLPFQGKVALDGARRAVESVPGLRGWVGVDLIWEPASGGLTVLEINPRPTTSLVGWSRLLRPPGRLAALWMRAIERPGPWAEDALAHPPGRSVEFAADGTILEPGAGGR
jgi:predicted ATP-grasp superfamily ATP-dependent carboligase